MKNEIVHYDGDEIVVTGTRVLERIGTPEERKFLIEVMAEQLGIPSSEARRADVLAVLANAAQRTVQFGWQPGIHMHVQPFNETVDGVKVKKWVLVDGEKAWKDSADRHRRNGVRFAIITRPQAMSKEEMIREVSAMGLSPNEIAQNAYGVYAKVVLQDEFEIAAMVMGRDVAFDAIPWAAGMYTGKKRVGKYWNDDSLPTSVSPKDVAIRRAHKRALMQSTLPLIPLDDKSESQRITDYAEELRREELHKRRYQSMPSPRPALDAFDEEILNGPISDLSEVPEWDGTSPAPTQLVEDAQVSEVTGNSVPSQQEEKIHDHRKMGSASDAQLNTLHALGMALYATKEDWDTKRAGLVQWATNGRAKSSAELYVADAVKLQEALEKKLRIAYAQVAEGWPSPFDLDDIDSLHGVELANAMKKLRALVAAPQAAQAKKNAVAAIRN